MVTELDSSPRVGFWLKFLNNCYFGFENCPYSCVVRMNCTWRFMWNIEVVKHWWNWDCGSGCGHGGVLLPANAILSPGGYSILTCLTLQCNSTLTFDQCPIKKEKRKKWIFEQCVLRHWFPAPPIVMWLMLLFIVFTINFL